MMRTFFKGMLWTTKGFAASAALGVGLAFGFAAPPSRADVVTDWTRTTTDAIAASQPPPDNPRTLAIVNASIFDAINGVDQVYVPYHVEPAAQPGASRRAAAAQAAYATLLALMPDQKPLLDSRLASSLADIKETEDEGRKEDDTTMASGIAWGQAVAEGIVAWRANDGYSMKFPPFTGGTDPGEWRPTPPKLAPGAGFQLTAVTPFAMASPSQFRPGPPPDLRSDRYAADLNEIKAVGRKDSTVRTEEQTDIAKFWLAPVVNTNILWNSIALTLAAAHPKPLVDEARVLALLHIAQADAIIAGTEAKYHYVRWRPITAIQLADTDGNPATDPDPAWTPFLDTPADPDYPSNAGTGDGANAEVLAAFYDDSNTFTAESTGLPGQPRAFTSIWGAATEGSDARVYQGVHFRTSVRVGEATAKAVADYVMSNLMQPLDGGGDLNRDGRVDLKDVVLALEGVTFGWGSTAEQKAADLDHSGTSDAMDAISLLRKAVGLSSP